MHLSLSLYLTLSFPFSFFLTLSLSPTLSFPLSLSPTLSLYLSHCLPPSFSLWRWRGGAREREREREREGGRESCGRAESLSVPHSFSQSACVFIILILIIVLKFNSGFQRITPPSRRTGPNFLSWNISSSRRKTSCQSPTSRSQCYKSFYGRNLRISVIS